LLREQGISGKFSLQGTFTSLKYPNYRLWFAGQLVSLIGTWTQTAAQGYLIYELTKSPAYLGYLSFANGLPTWIFTLYAGAIADRVSKRTLMVITQSGMMILALILAILTFSNIVQWWHILILSFLLGVFNAFDAPARQAFTLEMVDREDLTNAIALNSTMFNLAMVMGPAFGGLIYAWVGPGWCFTINAISFLAVIIALLLMKLKPFIPVRSNRSALSDVKEGLSYVVNHPSVKMLIFNLFITTLFALGIAALIPAWSVQVLGGDAATNGFLMAARGIGSLISALLIAALGHFRFRGKLWTINSLLLPITMLLFALLQWMIPSLLIMAGMGFAFMMIVNLSNAMVQTRIADEMRGRVMGVYTFFFFGAMPIGALISGWSADIIGEPLTVFISAVILLLFALWVIWRRPTLRALE
jgi:MFS family permease